MKHGGGFRSVEEGSGSGRRGRVRKVSWERRSGGREKRKEGG